MRNGWPEVALGEICDIKGGKRLPRGSVYATEKTDFPYLRVTDFRKGKIEVDGLRYLTSDVQSKISRYTVSAGDVIISIAGSIGQIACVPETLDGANLTENAAKLVRKDSAMLNPDYLAAFLRSRHAQAQIAANTGQVTIGKLALFRIASLQMPLPTSEEQRRIAAILDAADALRAKRREAIAKLDTFPQAIFIDIFGDPASIESESCRLTDLADLQVGFPFKSSTFTGDESGVRICRGANVLPRRVHWKDTQRVPHEIAETQRRYALMEGDVVVAMDRPWISSGFKIAAVGPSDEGAMLVQRVARLRARSGVPSSFVYELLRLPAFTRHCAPTETTIPHISPSDFRGFTFPKPSTAQLAQWARHESTVDVLRSNAADAHSRVDALFGSLQQRAFRGEL